MEEQIKPTEQEKPTETKSIIEQADSVARRIEEANKRAEEILAKTEEAFARLTLGGRTEAGGAAKKAEPTTDELVDAQVKEALNRYKLR